MIPYCKLQTPRFPVEALYSMYSRAGWAMVNALTAAVVVGAPEQVHGLYYRRHAAASFVGKKISTVFFVFLFPPVLGLKPKLEHPARFLNLVQQAREHFTSLDQQGQTCGAGNFMKNDLRRCLKSNWGHERFRPYQLEVHVWYAFAVSHELSACGSLG